MEEKRKLESSEKQGGGAGVGVETCIFVAVTSDSKLRVMLPCRVVP